MIRWRRSAFERLAEAAGGIGGGGHGGRFAAAGGVGGEVDGRGLGNACADVQIHVIFGASRAVAFAGVFIAEAGQFVAATDAIAVAGFGSSLDRDERHNRQILRFRLALCKRGLQRESGIGVFTVTSFSDAPSGRASRDSRAARANAAPGWT
jgi:hypothetical protein